MHGLLMGEMRADRNLTDKLLADLSGIFNWIYAGYKILRDAKQFSVPADQLETMEGFSRDINPVVSFIEDEVTTGEISRDILYKKYVDWCKANGHMAMSRTSFIRRFRATMTQLKRPCEEIRGGNYRGFKIE